ncbi:unnamed protein product, partial [Dovyalis caffra]
ENERRGIIGTGKRERTGTGFRSKEGETFTPPGKFDSDGNLIDITSKDNVALELCHVRWYMERDKVRDERNDEDREKSRDQSVSRN